MDNNVLPRRKNIRLKDWDYSQNGAYFITICAKDKRHIFGKIKTIRVGCDAHIAPYVELSQYGEIIEKYISNIPGIDEYSIMPNHIHMIIRIEDNHNGTMRASSPTQGIPQIVKSFKIMVSKECGESIFQRSYYDHIIRNEMDYMEKVEYILTNSAKWAEDEYYFPDNLNY